MKFPEKIYQWVGDQAYEKNEVGMSESDVLIFPEYVLKIQKKNIETENEVNMLRWLNGRIPAAKICEYVEEDDISYTLMTRVKGEMLCAKKYLTDPETLCQIAADGLKKLWNVDIKDCPYRTSRLEERLKKARNLVERGIVDIENAEPETYGPDGFQNPEELLNWLETHQPEEDLVLTHGDYCLPNIFVEGKEILAFIDLGKAGPADRWQDVAIALRTIHHNLSGYYGGKKYADFEPKMLLEKLGLEMDEKKMRYYLLLDELF